MEANHRYNYCSLSIALTFVTCLVISRVIYALFLSPYSHVPGPRICKVTRLWVDLHDIFLRRNQQIYKWHEEYGPIVLIAPGEVSVSSASSTKKIYRAGTQHPKSSFFDNFTMYGERTIFTALNCVDHRAMRKSTFSFYQPTTVYSDSVMGPLRERVRLFVDEMNDSTHAHSMVGVDIFKLTNSYAFDNITSLVYGPNHTSQSLASVKEKQTILEDWAECEVWNNLLYTFPLAHKFIKFAITRLQNPQFLHAEEKLFEWNMNILDSTVQNISTATGLSLVGRLLKDKKGSEVPRRTFLAAECLDNIHAAQTTVSLSLTYAIWLLAIHRRWQHEARTELESLPLEEDGMPSFDAIKKAQILEACLRESLRTKPLSSGRAERIVPETNLYDDVMIPAGVSLARFFLKPLPF